MLDLKELSKKFDEVFKKETKKSLTDWLQKDKIMKETKFKVLIIISTSLLNGLLILIFTCLIKKKTISDYLFVTEPSGLENLKKEGITRGVELVGDVMYDVALYYKARAKDESKIQEKLKILPGCYVLATCHRADNTDDLNRLSEILKGLASTAKKMPVILPLHPRTRKLIQDFQLENLLTSLIVTDPLPFLDMVALEQDAALIITDSGGVQKEAFFYDVPCITMRDETEWVETVSLGWNKLVGANAANLTQAVDQYLNEKPKLTLFKPYGNGSASNTILNCLIQS
jgi:UDP-GlcNAc3NAcA epimerase